MSSFCPLCANLLLVKTVPKMAYYCRTCPYTQIVAREIRFPLHLTKKKVDDVLGGDAAWENVDRYVYNHLFIIKKKKKNTTILRTKINCPKCGYGEAFFMQIQTRSADEVCT